MRTHAAVAPVWVLAAVVVARRLLIGEGLLLAAPFDLALPASLVGQSGNAETGRDGHACQVRRQVYGRNPRRGPGGGGHPELSPPERIPRGSTV